MANEEHLAILKQGVEVWNQWRKENPAVRPDLGKVDLVGADLTDTDLSKTNLTEASLSHANLGGAYLSNANLNRANLSEAYLNITRLHSATLQSANLRGAELLVANFYRTDLSGANFENALIGGTIFGDVDLSMVKGLDTVRHQLPSVIGIDTIYHSKGKIPEVFLRGCGVPDNFIAYVGSLVGKAFEYYSCFISHSSKDQELAERLHADLQAKGVRCWFAPEDLKIGDKFRTRIDEAIRHYDKLLLILSEHSIHSDWVEKEVETAFEKERQRKQTVLFPVRLDDVIWGTELAWAADIRRTRHIGDFCRWTDLDAYQKAFERLLRDLKAESAAADE